METTSYKVDDRRTVAEAPGLRVRILTLGPGQEVPWHAHTRITDTFVCLDGPMRIETGAPGGGAGDTHILAAGGMFAAPPDMPHRVSPATPDGHCRFLIVQGVGTYDFVPLEPPGA